MFLRALIFGGTGVWNLPCSLQHVTGPVAAVAPAIPQTQNLTYMPLWKILHSNNTTQAKGGRKRHTICVTGIKVAVGQSCLVLC